MFSEFQFLLILKLKKCFFVASLDHFMAFSFVLTTFAPILDVFFLCFGQIHKFKMAGQDGRHSEMFTQLLRHVTYYVLLKSHCYSYLILGVTGEEGGGAESASRS